MRLKIKDNLIIFLFLFSLFFFIYQHIKFVDWDFMVYVLNSNYWFNHGFYFELARAPLVPFFLGLFSFFGIIKEYIYIVFVSALFLFSCLKLAESFKIDKRIFYAFSVTPFLLYYGLLQGSELLSLSFINLYLANLSKTSSGVFFSLAMLTRYTNFFYFPLIFLQKNIKKIVKTFLLVFLVFLPWFVYNYFFDGNPISSLVNFFALNSLLRGYISEPFSLVHMVFSIGILLPFFVIGLKKIKLDKKTFAMLLLFLITFVIYIKTANRELRFLFNFITPVAYFSYLGFKNLNKKFFYIIILLNLIIALFLLGSIIPRGQIYQDAISDLDNCSVKSNSWVPLNYYGTPAEQDVREELYNYYINNGYRILLFKQFLSEKINYSYPIFKETEGYIIFGDEEKCKAPVKVDRTYLDRLNETIFLMYNYTIDINPYKVLWYRPQF